MINLPNYKIIEEIHESDRSLVYRARHLSDNQPVILKILKQAYPPPERIAQFQREYELTKSLDIPGAVKAYRIVETNDRYWAMVVEDFGGKSLKQVLRNLFFTIDTFLSVAIKVSKILGELNQQRIIHKDINPSNIVWNQETDELKIIDFGISSKLSRETATIRNPNLLEGTLAYISPEQTGRMNRAIDYRTDFYSLGATFYELLTGKLPFTTNDPLELVHSHIAKQPTPPHQLKPEIPRQVSEIVLKLMAKNAEDRYQSAAGIEADLLECQRQQQTEGQIHSFPLARRDVIATFQIPQKLYGREREIETLLAGFDRVSLGSSEIMLVAGYSGIGKSALVKEIYKPITRQRGYFISGKFDQYQRNIPYASLIQAFSALIRQLLAESQAQIEAWREQLLAVLGANAGVIIDVIPELEAIVGKQPPVTELPPTEVQNRFNAVFENFIRAFAQQEHPLVLFLDDLQWADGASLKLISILMTATNSHYLFLIGAYRDNEVDAAHPWMLTLEEIKKAGATVNQILLAPLQLGDAADLAGDALNCSPEKVKPLAELVLAKTDGNPFFMGEFLKSLHAEELLKFDYQQGRWQWDLARIEVRQMTDNVVELMAGKLRKLPEETQRALQLAACIGNQFELTTLAVIYEKTPPVTATYLRAALEKGLVYPLGDAYKLAELNVEGLAESVKVEYNFAHDRIQQAAYSLIPEKRKQALHWQIGKLLLANVPPEAREQNIFDLVNQLNQGCALAESQRERDDLARLNLTAGRKAKASAAFQAAFNYLQISMELLESSVEAEDTWQRQYELAIDLYLEAAEAAWLSGRIEELDPLTDTVIKRAKTAAIKINAYHIKLQAYITMQKSSEAIELGFQALEFLGIRLPENATQADLTRRMEEIKALWEEQKIENLINQPEMTDATRQAAMPLLFLILALGSIGLPSFYYPLLNLEFVNIPLKFGNTAWAALAYVSYAYFLCAIDEIESGYAFGKLSLKVLEKFNAKQLEAKTVYVFNTFVRHWKEHLSNSLKPLMEIHKNRLETGDLNWGCLAIFLYSFNSYWQGRELSELEGETIKGIEAIEGHKIELARRWIELVRIPVISLRGKTENPCYFVGENYHEERMLSFYEEINDCQAIVYMSLSKAFICYLFEDYQQARESLARTENNLEVSLGLYITSIFYFYDSLVRLALFPDAPESEQAKVIEKVTANQAKMETWAHHAHENYLHKYYLVEAERARILGNHGDAREHYDRAIEGAKENKYLNEEALANELAGRYYLSRNQNPIALFYLQEARYAYQRWGAVAKVEDLEAKYPELVRSTTLATKDVTSTDSTGTSKGEMLDLSAVMKASLALSGEIVLHKLLAKLMKIAIENAGAQKGYLLLQSDTGQWNIEAEGRIDTEAVATHQSQTTDNNASSAIINYVARTQESVVLADAANEGQYTRDPYIIATKPKSILCTPLVNQGKLSGILYLENNLATGTFTKERTQILQVLSGQAAIAIDNARLYNQLESYSRNLEDKVEERTVQLAEATRKAETANEAKSAFLANMSHELRTPLNAILGFSQILTRSQTLAREQQENVSIISRSGEHLLTLINQVLDLSKIEAGRITLNPKNFDLYRLLDDIEDLLGLKAGEKGLQLVCERDENTPRYLNADELKLRQVLINLLNNAIKFTEEGGVSIRVRPQAIAEGSPNIELEFEIEDTGAGIAPEDIDSLFEAFVQTETGKQSQEGTGLGLPISRKFVQLMGGDITVTSTVGRGTTFKFNIEATIADSGDVESKQSKRRAIALAPNQPRYRLLVVDDKPINCQLLIKLLVPFGFDVREAANGREAVDIYTEWQPDLIFMDLRMPVMDGYEATQHIKAAPGEKPCPVVAVTASVLEEEKAVVLEAGCDDFIRKPFKDGEILEAIARHLGAEFIYEESATETVAVEEEALTAKALAAVPSELLAAIEEGLFTLDQEELKETIDAIATHSPAVARQLESLVNGFAYETILNLIEDSKQL